jgi:hypothetical protein
MLATAIEHYLYFQSDHAAQPLEVHRSKISLHHAKSGYDYPTIRLPHTFSKLAGLSTHIYQTVHDGALAFLVVVSSAATEKGANRSENAVLSAKSSVFTRRRSPVRIRPSPLFLGCFDEITGSGELFALLLMFFKNQTVEDELRDLR